MYYLIGWVGFAAVFGYNLGYFGIGLVEVWVGWRVTNQERVDCSRQEYYYDLLS